MPLKWEIFQLTSNTQCSIEGALIKLIFPFIVVHHCERLEMILHSNQHAWQTICMNGLPLRNVNHPHPNHPDKCFVSNNGVDDRNTFDKY